MHEREVGQEEDSMVWKGVVYVLTWLGSAIIAALLLVEFLIWILKKN